MAELPHQSSDGGLILRTAAKRWTCAGDGSASHRHAADCARTIEPYERYVECLWEAPAYSSGSRHTLACAAAFFDFQAEAQHG